MARVHARADMGDTYTQKQKVTSTCRKVAVKHNVQIYTRILHRNQTFTIQISVGTVLDSKAHIVPQL